MLPVRYLLSLAAAATLAASSGCSGEVARGSVDGKELFATACATCHGPLGTPPASMVAQLGVKDLRSAEFRSRVTREGVAHQIRAGSANKLMPAFAGALSEAQIAALAAYVVERIGTSPAPTGRAPDGRGTGAR